MCTLTQVLGGQEHAISYGRELGRAFEARADEPVLLLGLLYIKYGRGISYYSAVCILILFGLHNPASIKKCQSPSLALTGGMLDVLPVVWK